MTQRHSYHFNSEFMMNVSISLLVNIMLQNLTTIMLEANDNGSHYGGDILLQNFSTAYGLDQKNVADNHRDVEHASFVPLFEIYNKTQQSNTSDYGDQPGHGLDDVNTILIIVFVPILLVLLLFCCAFICANVLTMVGDF